MPKRKQTKQDFYDNIKLKEIEGWNPEEAVRRLNKQLRENRAEIKKIYEWKFPLKKNLEKTVDSVLGVRHKNKQDFIDKLMKEVKTKAKKVMIQDSVNKAYANLNEGEIQAAKASGQRVAKIWTTYFDEKVRNWHARLDSKKVLLNTKFRAPFPGGEDFLVAPKIPPISKANFINCRCFLEYEVGKKKK